MNLSIDTARRALLSRDPDVQRSGVEVIEALSAQGDPTAAYARATWFLHGSHGYPLDFQAAASLLQYAVEGGVPEAAYDLATLVETEQIGPKPRRQAFGYYVLASALGDRDAVGELARCFHWGVGTYRNKAIARHLSDLASDRAAQPRAPT